MWEPVKNDVCSQRSKSHRVMTWRHRPKPFLLLFYDARLRSFFKKIHPGIRKIFFWQKTNAVLSYQSIHSFGRLSLSPLPLHTIFNQHVSPLGQVLWVWGYLLPLTQLNFLVQFRFCFLFLFCLDSRLQSTKDCWPGWKNTGYLSSVKPTCVSITFSVRSSSVSLIPWKEVSMGVVPVEKYGKPGCIAIQ